MRLGCVTSSRIHAATAVRKKGEGELAARRKLRAEILCEIFTKKPAEHFVSMWMENGKKLEATARTVYEVQEDVMVQQIGFAFHDIIKMAGASPDGLVGDDGLVEFKCPRKETHIDYIMHEQIDEEYMSQMYWQMACTGRQWCDFATYCPDMPKDRQLYCIRVHRNEAEINRLESGAEQFLREIEQYRAEIDMKVLKAKGQSREEFLIRKSIAQIDSKRKKRGHIPLSEQTEDFLHVP